MILSTLNELNGCPVLFLTYSVLVLLPITGQMDLDHLLSCVHCRQAATQQNRQFGTATGLAASIYDIIM